MIRKIRQWLDRRKANKAYKQRFDAGMSIPSYTVEEVKKLIGEAKVVAYNDGKRDGLSIAREQATRSLREILKSQNTGK